MRQRCASDAPARPVHAQRTANKQIQRDGTDRETVAWDEHCEAQRGLKNGREACIKLAKRFPTGLSRYCNAMLPRPVGVQTLGTSVRGDVAARLALASCQ